MTNSAGTRQGWANSIAADMVVRSRSPPGTRLSSIACSPTTGWAARASRGLTSRPSPALTGESLLRRVLPATVQQFLAMRTALKDCARLPAPERVSSRRDEGNST